MLTIQILLVLAIKILLVLTVKDTIGVNYEDNTGINWILLVLTKKTPMLSTGYHGC